MTSNDQKSDNTRKQSRAAVEGNKDIQSQVHDIVVSAIVEHDLGRDDIKRVIDAVLKGAMEGASKSSKDLKDIMIETADGLDEGLSKAAKASQLAIEEAASRVDEFSDKDIKRAVDDLKDLGGLFTEAVKDLAKSGTSTTKGMLGDLLKHVERTSSATSQSVNTALEALGGSVSKVKRPDLAGFEKATRSGVATIASIASGFLEGIADSARHEKPPSDPDSEQKEK